MNENSSLNLNPGWELGFGLFCLFLNYENGNNSTLFKENNKDAPTSLICNLLQFYD